MYRVVFIASQQLKVPDAIAVPLPSPVMDLAPFGRQAVIGCNPDCTMDGDRSPRPFPVQANPAIAASVGASWGDPRKQQAAAIKQEARADPMTTP
jgi:hypothetical protein